MVRGVRRLYSLPMTRGLNANVLQGLSDDAKWPRRTGSEEPPVDISAEMLRPFHPAPPLRIPSVPVTRFESGHGWGSATGVTQVSNDTSVPGLGTQTMKLTTQANTYGFTRRTGLPAVDLSTRHPRLWLIVENPAAWTGGGSISLLAAPTGGLGSSAYFSWQINLDVPANFTDNAVMTPAGALVCIDLPWATVFTSGAPAKTAIVDWQISINAGSVAGNVVWLAGIDTVSNLPTKYPNGVVTLCFDDTYSGQWDLARPALTKYGYPAHLFPITSQIDQSGSLTTAQLRTLQDVLGWEVGAHATTPDAHAGYALITGAALRREMARAADGLTSRGLRVNSYAYPLGTFTANAANTEASKMFRAARTINPSCIGALPPSAPWQLRSRSGVGGSGGFGVTSSGTSGTYGLLNAAKSGTGWVILTMHNITSAASGNVNTISAADLGTLVDSINGLGMEVATITQVMDVIRS